MAIQLLKTFVGDLESEDLLTQTVFQPINIVDNNQNRSFFDVERHKMSIDDIIEVQQDEPNQKNCVYKIDSLVEGRQRSKYSQIRVKSVEFDEEDATAFYMYDFTHQFSAFELENKVQKARVLNESLTNTQITISHEFRTPLSSVLMLLDNVLNFCELDRHGRKLVWQVIQQINLLLFLVGDILDTKMMQHRGLQIRKVAFSPIEVLNFINNLF